MQCKPNEWQIEAPWGELSHRQLHSSSASPHLPPPLPQLPPLAPPLALNESPGHLSFNVLSWGNPLSPPVFLAHGRQDCAMTFQPLQQLMNAEDLYCVSINMPGSGNSAPLPNEPQGRATTNCLSIEVPEEPFSADDREVTLILARDRHNRDTDQATFDVPTRDILYDMPRPKIIPAFYTPNQDKDFVVIKIEEEDSDARSNRFVMDTDGNLEVDYNANLPANIQPNAEQDQHNPISICDDGDKDWADIEDDKSDLEEWTQHLQSSNNVECHTKKVNIDYLENTSKLELTSVEFKHSRNKPLVLTPQNEEATAFLTNAIENLNIHGQKQMKCRSSQRRKRGIKLMKISQEHIVCNDHGGRQCPFASSAYQLPSEREFSMTVIEKGFISSSLLRKMARGWAWRIEFAVKDRTEDASQNPAPQNSASSPVFKQNDTKECVLAECPHMPPGLIACLHAFFKDNKMQQHANGMGTDTWASNVQQSPVVLQNQQPIGMPSIYQACPQTYFYAPTAPPYSPGYFAPTPYISRPATSSSIRDFTFPGYYNPMGSASAYNCQYMYPDRCSPKAANSLQYRPSCESPRTYFAQPTPSLSYDQFVPCPILQPDGLSCCCGGKMLNSQECVPSNLPWRQNMQNNEDFYETATAEGVKIMRFHFVAAMEAAIEHLGWNKFIFMGHSLGSEIGLFYNCVNPGKITKMVLFDPEPTFRRLQVRDLPRYQTLYYDNYYDNYWKDNFYYRTYTIPEAKQALMRARNLTEDKASIIVSNSLKHVSGDQYRFTWDRRLKMPAPQNYPNAYYFALFSNIPSTLVISASGSLGEQSQSGSLELLNMLSTLKNYNHVMVEGDHDVHLTHPERVAPHVIEFLKKETKVNSRL